MGKCFAPNAVRCSHGLEGTTRPIIGMFVCLTNTTGIAFKSKNTVKYPDFLSALKQVPHSVQFPVPTPPENLTFNDDSSDADEDRGQQEGDNVDYDQILETSCSSCEPHLLTPCL
jgi:hypothetical protein